MIDGPDDAKDSAFAYADPHPSRSGEWEGKDRAATSSRVAAVPGIGLIGEDGKRNAEPPVENSNIVGMSEVAPSKGR